MDERTNGWTNGRTDERKDRRTEGLTDERTDGWTDGRTDSKERRNGRMDEWMDVYTNGLNRWTDGRFVTDVDVSRVRVR